MYVLTPRVGGRQQQLGEADVRAPGFRRRMQPKRRPDERGKAQAEEEQDAKPPAPA